jgi:hypothetical protein
LIKDGQKERSTIQADEEEIVVRRIKVEGRDERTRIDGKEIGNLVVELTNGAGIRGRKEEIDVPLENRRIEKTMNRDLDMFSILANTRAISEPDVDICFCHEPSM